MTLLAPIEVPTSVSFFVGGKPATQGSKVAFKHAVSGKIIVIDSNKNNPAWRAEVSFAAREAMQDIPVFDGPVRMSLSFHLPRPKGDFKRDGSLAKRARLWPTVKPDLIKLTRSVEDAMTGFVYDDDSQVVVANLVKNYGEAGTLGVGVHVERL